MNFFRPKFLRKIDDYLLINYPIIWISRIHYVFFYSLFSTLLITLIAFGTPITIGTSNNRGLFLFLFTISSIVFLCFWIYRNAIHNHEKNYGKRSIWDEYKLFGLYYICVLLIFSFNHVFSFALNYRLANVVSDEELVEIINTANLLEPLIDDGNSFQMDFNQAMKEIQEEIDSSKLSIEEKNYITGTFTPSAINSYEYSKKLNILSKKELEERFEKIKDDKAQLKALINKLIPLLKKIDIKTNYDAESIYNNYKYKLENDFEKTDITSNLFDCKQEFSIFNINSLFQFGGCIERNIGEVAQYKYGEPNIVTKQIFPFRSVFYFLIVIFFMTLRNVHWPHFILTLVVLIFYPIITLVVSLLLRFSSSGDSQAFIFFTLQILLYVFALIISLIFIFQKKKKYSGFTSLCLQISNLGAPFILSCVIMYFGTLTNVFWNDDVVSDYIPYDTKLNLYYWSFWINIALYVIFFMPFFKEQFVKHRALPHNK